MAHRHLITVCVVCLLCVDHLPHIHVLADENINLASSDVQKTKEFRDYTQDENNIPLNYHYDKRMDKVKSHSSYQRQKRHAGHGHTEHHHQHHIEAPKITKDHIEKIFKHFSNDSNTMDFDGFNKMTSNLALNNLFNEQKDSCINQEFFLEKMLHHEHHEHHDDEEEEEDHDHDIEISAKDFLSICPILLYYASNPNSTCLQNSNFIDSTKEKEDFAYKIAFEDDKATVWLYSTLAIVLVSLCGLLGIAVIPIMDMHFYHHALQFLVALAVGTLAGDALLHLMPHSMMKLHEDQDMHKTMMYRGLAAMSAIVFFYFFERFLVMITEWRQKKEKREKPSSRVRVMREHDTLSLNGNATTCKHKYSSYPYCYDEIAMDTKDDHHEHQHKNLDKVALNPHYDHVSVQNELIGTKRINGMIHELSNEIDNNTLTLSTSIDEGSIESNIPCNNNKQISGNPVSNALVRNQDIIRDENFTIILRFVLLRNF